MRSLRSELIEKGVLQARTSAMVEVNREVRDKPIERMSDRELADLMGTNRPTYARGKGGAFRQR